MAKVKTNELIGPALDWAVAKCNGRDIEFDDPIDPWLTRNGISDQPLHSYTPSTDWAQGGPIIGREITKVFRNVGGTWSAMILRDVPIPYEDQGTSLALTRRAQWNGAGITPLIASMRCYVASKLGDEVELPDGLLC